TRTRYQVPLPGMSEATTYAPWPRKRLAISSASPRSGNELSCRVNLPLAPGVADAGAGAATAAGAVAASADGAGFGAAAAIGRGGDGAGFGATGTAAAIGRGGDGAGRDAVAWEGLELPPISAFGNVSPWSTGTGADA